LGDAYGATIERIKAQARDKPRLGIAALMWISYAERQLMADELCRALAIQIDYIFQYRQHPFDHDISGLLSKAYHYR